MFFFFQAEDGIRDGHVTGVQTCALPISPDEWQALARVFDNYQRAELLETGLIAEGKEGRRYDRFRGRIIFPIRNHRGVTVGFGGRLIAEGEPKIGRASCRERV